MLLLLAVLLAGCSIDGGGATISPLFLKSPFLTSETSQVVCSPTSASRGAVAGVLRLANSQPAKGSILYLGEYVGLETANPTVILDPSKHPRAQTGEEGRFCFPDVSPGNYGLIVWNAVESVLLADPVTGDSLLVKVEAGITTEVGIVYSPIP